MSNYRELQKKAKSLGLPSNGNIKKLTSLISEYEKSNKDEVEEVVEEVETEEVEVDEVEEVKEEPKETEEKYNAAVVFNKSGNEIRIYTFSIHGKDFAEMAKSYSNKKDYSYKLKFVRPAIICPHCGGKIYRN